MAQTVLAAAASAWAVLMGIAPLLQIRRMLRHQSSREVSVGYFTILLIGFLLWIAYGAAARIPALVIPNAVAVLVGVAVIIVALRLRRQPARSSSPPMIPRLDERAWSRKSALGFVLERELELGPVGDRSGVVQGNVLLHDLRHSKIADCPRCRPDRLRGRVLP